MTKKDKILIAIGGTGGHVFPGCNLAEHLIGENFHVELVSDKRGQRYLKKYGDLKTTILPSTPLISKNIFLYFFSILIILYSSFYSLIFLIWKRPSIIFGMGGYSSFPICIMASILRIKFIIYENNLVLGKANKYLLPFCKKILVSNKELEGIPNKYSSKVVEIGNIIDKKIFNFSKITSKNLNGKLIKILIIGGSQAAKIFAEVLPNIFRKCFNQGINFKIYQHCLPDQKKKLKDFYEKSKIDCETFHFSDNLIEYFLKVNLAITRSGSSMISELTNAHIPFISVPLPSSAENHQLKNAMYYERKKLAFLIEEKDLNDKLLYLIKDIYEDRSKLDKIINNQRQYSDKNVYENINQILKKIINEKN